MSAEYVLDTRELDRIARDLGRNRDDIVNAIAFEVEGQAKINAPYRTGALKNSIHTKTAKGGGSSFVGVVKRLGRLSAQKGKASVGSLNVSELPNPGEGEAIVGSGLEYAAYVEFGTSRMQARPFLGRAFDGVIRKYLRPDKWKKLVT